MADRLAVVLRSIAAALLLLAAMGSSAQADKRVALVIGNSAYSHARSLVNPTNDAKLMSGTLLSLGFFVVGGGAKVDLDKAGFDAALKDFQKELIGADVALFYYAGHSVETHGLNYLVPVDARITRYADVPAQAFRLNDLVRELAELPAAACVVEHDDTWERAVHGALDGEGGGQHRIFQHHSADGRDAHSRLVAARWTHAQRADNGQHVVLAHWSAPLRDPGHFIDRYPSPWR